MFWGLAAAQLLLLQPPKETVALFCNYMFYGNQGRVYNVVDKRMMLIFSQIILLASRIEGWTKSQEVSYQVYCVEGDCAFSIPGCRRELEFRKERSVF